MTGAGGTGSKALVWTRGADDWASDAPLLAALPAGVQLVRLPCVALAPRPALPARERYDHVVLTSAHAVDFALADTRLAPLLRGAQGVWTHGAATAARLRAAGLAVTLVDGARTGAELGAALVARLPEGASVLLPTAAEPAYDLAAWLRGQGFAAEAAVCYETAVGAREVDGRALADSRRDELAATLTGIVCFGSPSAVAGFAAELLPGRLSTALVAAVIGPTTAAAAAERAFARVVTARENSLAALVATAVAALKSAPG